MLPAKNGAFDGSAGESSAISQLLNPARCPRRLCQLLLQCFGGCSSCQLIPPLVLLRIASLQGWEHLTKPWTGEGSCHPAHACFSGLWLLPDDVREVAAACSAVWMLGSTGLGSSSPTPQWIWGTCWWGLRKYLQFSCFLWAGHSAHPIPFLVDRQCWSPAYLHLCLFLG